MAATVLDVELVEKLQRAASKAKSIEPYVSALTSATLPGMVEYGCLRHQYPLLPELPPALIRSAAGVALADVNSSIGLRMTGKQKTPPSLMTPQNYEFIVLASDENMTGSRWIEFASRFAMSVTGVGFHRQKALEVSAAMREMADNAVCHSESTNGILVGYEAVENYAVCVVADVGTGILRSLQTNERYARLTTHADAIETALKAGESRYGFGKGGTGFSSVFKYVAEARGTLRFRSGEAFVLLDGQDEHTDKTISHSVAFRPGFQVTICCRSSNRPAEEKLI